MARDVEFVSDLLNFPSHDVERPSVVLSLSPKPF